MTRTTNSYAILAVAAAVSLAAGASAGYWWAQRKAGTASETSAAPTAGERKVLYWYDPMMPDQRFDKPGKSPFMDMPLVPKYADDVASSGVRIDTGVRQNVGIRTAPVETGTLATQIRVPATLAWDLREESVVSARADGVVTRLFVKAPFEQVRRGQALVSLLAPEWSSALAEAQALGQARSASARELQSAAQQRLRVLGASGRNGSGGLELVAPRDGVVSEILVREGQAVIAGTPLFRVNGTATLWLEAAIPQANAAGIEPGTSVTATVDAVPGATFAGVVETLLPQIDAASRTQRARIVLRNPQGRLVPGMFAQLQLRPEGGPAVPLVPSEALIATGADSRVIVVGKDGSFQPVHVRIGRSAGGKTEILAGLKGGERVVTSGQFLIDSEASLSGALGRLGVTAPETDVDAPAVPMPEPSGAQEAKRQEDHDAHDGHDGHDQPKAGSLDTRPRVNDANEASRRGTDSPERQCPVAYWYDPMVPDKHFDKPGKSPFMDMQLVPSFGPQADTDCTVRDVEGAQEPQR